MQVKLTDFAIANCIERWEKSGCIAKETLKDGEDKSGASQLTSEFDKFTGPHGTPTGADVLYCAPELLKNRESNRRRGMEQSEQEALPFETFPHPLLQLG